MPGDHLLVRFERKQAAPGWHPSSTQGAATRSARGQLPCQACDAIAQHTWGMASSLWVPVIIAGTPAGKVEAQCSSIALLGHIATGLLCE